MFLGEQIFKRNTLRSKFITMQDLINLKTKTNDC